MNSRGGSERWINVCLSSPAVAAAATCDCLEKGRYTALQSQPINRPSSGRHAGGPPHKDSPYGVTLPPHHPPTSKCFIRWPRPYTQLSDWRGSSFFPLFLKQQPTGIANRPRDLIKIFSASAFPRRRGAGRGAGEKRRGSEAVSTGQPHAFISSLCPTI